MRLPSPPDLPVGGTPASRLDMVFSKVLTVSKDELVSGKIQPRSPSQNTGNYSFSLVDFFAESPVRVSAAIAYTALGSLSSLPVTRSNAINSNVIC